MKNKKIIMYMAIIILIIFILGIGAIILKNNKEKKQIVGEYTPVEEITDEQLRQTNITLYFCNNLTGELATEIRQIDAKKLLDNPQNELINYLIEGPVSDNLSKLIPEGTKLINSELKDGILLINFSEEFIKEQNLGLEQERKIVESIVKTLTQLNEINGIKILINGEENMGFPDEELNFKEIFILSNN